METDRPFTSSYAAAPTKKRSLFPFAHGNGLHNKDYEPMMMKTPNSKAFAADNVVLDLIKAHCSPVTSLAADLTSALEIGDASSMDNTPRKSLLAELAQKAATSDNIPKPQFLSTTVADVVSTNTSQSEVMLVEAQTISKRPMLPKPKFTRNNTASARLESSRNTNDEAVDLFGPPPPLNLKTRLSLTTTLELSTSYTKRSLAREFELGTASHWNRRGTQVQVSGSRGINLATIPLRKTNFPSLPRGPASAPPTVPIAALASSNSVQKRGTDVLDRQVLRFSPKKNFETILSLAYDDAMQIDTESQQHHIPPSKMRRTSSTSSFEEEEIAYVLPSPSDITPVGFTMAQGILPCVDTGGSGKDAFRRISPATLADLLDGKYNQQLDHFQVVDCRFPYEFNGGHILGAVNICTPVQMAKAFFHPPCTDKRVVIVFHCEFSAERAPTMAARLRKVDRSINLSHYPSLYYPEIYILKGGYKEFYADYTERCFPQHYIAMNHEAFQAECRQGIATHRREFRRANSFS